MKHPTLFLLSQPELNLEAKDVATSDDPLKAYLQRKGWDLKRVKELQNDISVRLTIDLFDGGIQELTGVQTQLQEHIQEFLDRQKKCSKPR